RSVAAGVVAYHEPDGVSRLRTLVEEAVGHGGVEADGVADLQTVFLEADLDPERAGGDVAVLPAVVAHQRFVGGGRSAHLVDGVEEIDVVVTYVEPLPPNTGIELDDLALVGAHQQIAGPRPRRPRLVVLSSAHQLVQRQVEFVDEGVQGGDGRIRLARLQLGDQAGGDTQTPGQLALAETGPYALLS